jgi:hypothetical protein
MYCDIAGDWMRAGGGKKIHLRPPMLITYLLLLINGKKCELQIHCRSACLLKGPHYCISNNPNAILYTVACPCQVVL